jgi:hypothetical protein
VADEQQREVVLDSVTPAGSRELATQLVDDRLRTRGVETIQQSDDSVEAELLAALIARLIFLGLPDESEPQNFFGIARY